MVAYWLLYLFCSVGGQIFWITKCTTTGYSFPLFSFLLKNEGRREGEKSVKPILNKFF
jgi:hypothetical protein